MLKEVFVVLCLMLAIVAAYPSEDVVKSVEPVAIESNESVSNEEQDLSGAESRYGFGGFGKGFGHFGGLGGFGFGRGFGFGHGFGGHGFGRYWG